MRVVVIGAGIAGLAAAHRVLEVRPDAELTVLEGAPRAGGIIGTIRKDGWVIEEGPDSILAEKPWALGLAQRLGLEGEILRTRAGFRGAYVVSRGRLKKIPDGFSLLAPGSLRALARSPVLSLHGKARAALELLVPKGAPRDDESLASFVERRFGRELLDRLAQPLAAGIYGGDPARLGLRATMPRFLDMEQSHGSVILAVKARARSGESSQGARYGMFFSFRRGMQTLVDALTARLGAHLRLGTPVQALERTGSEWRVRAHGDVLRADRVIVALPAAVAAPLLGPLDAALREDIGGVALGSSATVTFALREADLEHPLDAFGFVVPTIEQRAALASTWASVKFEGRAPPGHALIRVFLGGPGRDGIVDESDGSLVALATGELRALMGLRGAPLETFVRRYPRSMPQLEVGHLRRVERIEQRVATHPGLALTGTYLRGVGIPDSVRAAELAAEVVTDRRRS